MILLLDLGNSRIKWGYCHAGDVYLLGRGEYSHSTISELCQSIDKNADCIESVAGVSVTSRERQEWVESIINERLELGLDWFCPVAQACGVINGYDDPKQLGADRWAVLIAARSMASQGACIMDVGTAITIDGLDGQGMHLGGVIFPGTALLRNVVRDSLAGVRISSQDEESSRIPARNTNDAVTAGIYYGIGEVVKGLGKRMAAVCPQGSRKMVTGGGASGLIHILANDGWELCEDLVLMGVARIAQEKMAN